jgi:hypothetical protein
VTGDFNKANPKKEMPKFIQQVTCATRDGRTLDHCYTTNKGAYRSIPRAPFGRSRDLPSLEILYQQRLKMEEPLSSLKIHPILPMTYLNLFHLVADLDPSKPGPTALVLAFSP